jgi:hypothetical protein
MSADDYDADLAERYGYVNRALPDAQFAGFVDRFTARIARFDVRRSLTHGESYLPNVRRRPMNSYADELRRQAKHRGVDRRNKADRRGSA